MKTEKKKKNKYVLKRHDRFSRFFGPLTYILFHFTLGYKRLNKYKFKKGENAIILSNHQTDFDPVLIGESFNRNLYPVATETLFNGSLASKLLHFMFNPIPKKKGLVDLRCTRTIMEVIREGGSVDIFAEGNRTLAEFQFEISDAYVKLIRKLNVPVIIFNFNGGTGIYPRFASKKRKGKFTGGIKCVLKPEDYKEMSDEELITFIRDNLRVYDSESNELYKSNKRAEFLERILFVCPKCNGVSTLESNGNYVKCNNCGLTVEYTENLHLKSDDESFKFDILNDWYNFLKKWTREYEIKDSDTIIFKDKFVNCYSVKANEKRKLVSSGEISLTKDILSIGELKINVNDIEISSMISGKKFSLSTVNGDGYMIVGDDRFNPLKYVFMFNKLDTYMKLKETDRFYTIKE